MHAVAGLHARQRQLERHAERDPHLDDVRLVQRRKRRRDRDRRAETERQRARHGLEEVRRRIGKRIAGERADQHDRAIRGRAM